MKQIFQIFMLKNVPVKIGRRNQRTDGIWQPKSFLESFNSLNLNSYLYYMSKKSWPIVYRKVWYKLGKDFLDIQYATSKQKIYYFYVGIMCLGGGPD